MFEKAFDEIGKVDDSNNDNFEEVDEDGDDVMFLGRSASQSSVRIRQFLSGLLIDLCQLGHTQLGRHHRLFLHRVRTTWYVRKNLVCFLLSLFFIVSTRLVDDEGALSCRC